jgi:hypothetical protein
MSAASPLLRTGAIAGLAFLLSCDVSDPAPAPPIPGDKPVVVDSMVPTPLVIEEIVPGNVDLLDERGEDPGWVEISNLADTSVPLGAWRLRGKSSDGSGWRLPDTLLPPGARMLVFLSGLDRRRSLPAGDTVRGFTTEGHAWSDSLNDPPGRSSYGPWEIPGKLRGLLGSEGVQALSATMTLRDPDGTDLDWSSVEVAMTMPSGLVDVSGRDRLLLTATFPAGQPLLLRFCEEGQECWKGASVRIVGTGRPLDRYDISLLGVGTDFGKLAAVYFVPPTGRFGTYRLTVTDLRFYRSALRPHASFELHRKGAVLHLEDTAGRSRQSVAYPEMPATSSWARLPPTRDYAQREVPSPGGENPTDPPPAILPAPVFLTPTGHHALPVVVRLESVPGAIVRCAEAGAKPVASSAVATDGIRLDSTGVLSCAVFDSAGRSGPAVSGFFLVGERPTLPVLSVVVDPVAMFDSTTGLYMEGPNASAAEPYYGANFWEDTELPAEVEFHEKDGRRAFAEKAGVGIFGNWSRAKPKRPLSIQFREKYGARRVDWPLFPQRPELTRFKGFGLRNMGGDYASGLSRDAIGTSLTEGRDLEYQLSRHVVVYLNGRYWGIYDMREKLDADYLDTRFGLSSDRVDLLKNGGEVQAGTATGWNAMVDWFLAADLSDSAGLAQAAGMLDLDNMATYLAAEIWASNTDWPANNLRSWRRTSPATPWRMMLFDLDGGLGGFSGERDMFAFLGDSTVVGDYPNGPRSTVFFRKLSTNPAWRARFANRLSVLLSTNFSTERALAVLDSMQAEHAAEKVRDAARWDLSLSAQTSADARLRTFLRRRPAQVRSNMRRWYGFGDTAKVSLAAEGGAVFVEGYDLGASYAGVHFEGLPIRLEAKAPGRTFAGWSDGETAPERIVVPGPAGIDLIAHFR